MTLALVFVDQPTADKFSSDIDAQLGYPKRGTDVGGGFHAPPAVTVTARYGMVQKHPSLSQWAYPDDQIVVSQSGRVPVPVSASVQTLDATWYPVPTVSVNVQVG